MNHYVYLLQNKTDSLKYIGVRSCMTAIEKDPYMSSSKSATKDYLNNCVKTILKTFSSREQAVQYEICLHELYDVGRNPEFFNMAKQTATKFDQTGKIYSSLNPNAKVVDVYDHRGTLQMQLNGSITCKKGIPRNAIMKSYKNGGAPLGHSKQSRTELRKNMFQSFIGWYALIHGSLKTCTKIMQCDIEHEQKTGLFSKVRYSSCGANNPNSKTFIFTDAQGFVIEQTTGGFDSVCKQLKIPKGMAYKYAKLGVPIATKRKKYLHLNGILIYRKVKT